MNYDEVLNHWREYADTLYPWRDEVADIFETHYIWDERCNCTENSTRPNEDTVFLLKLSERLNDICDLVKSHISVLEHRVDIEEDIRANIEQAFEAWKRRLCPILMKSVHRYVKPPHYDV